MAIDAIGMPVPTATVQSAQTQLNQSDFIKLFLTELTYQDPLEPVNNREFLAQLAQFANLEQTRITNDNTSNLVTMNATAQSLGLLGHQVQINDVSGNAIVGTVSAITVTSNGPLLSIKAADNSVTTDVKLSQITLIRP